MRGRSVLVRAVGLAVAIAALVVAATSATGATALSLAPTGKLLFCSGTTAAKCTRAVYLASGDGSGVQKLTATPVVPRNLTWSPRGDHFLFTGYRTITPYGLYLGDLHGHIRQVAKGYVDGFAWTPSGSSFVYITSTSETRSGTSSLIIESASTLAKRSPLSAATCQPYDGPFISPDGTKAAFNVAGGGTCKAGLTLLDLHSGKTRLLSAYSPIHRVIVLGWRSTSSLVVTAGYPGSMRARLMTTSGRLSKLVPDDPNVLQAQVDEDGDPPYWNSVSANGGEILFSAETCQSSTVCGFATSIFDLNSHRLSAPLSGGVGGWSKHGSDLMTFGLDDTKTSTTLQLVSGAALNQEWTASVPMAIGDLVWSG